ncbi:hypothetical protein Gotri_024539 [Gossypium trilobum]|uniref:Uncharacterized protein n=1 Tax=Gossypium trilobum TaxID=34281 RepID=A0A7J9DMT3_9ROSI|nr:hypothetical protein [Gossypium trilobum]
MAQSRWTRERLLLGGVEDPNGQWILGFNRMLGLYSIFNAELWGILNGLIVLHNKRWDKTYSTDFVENGSTGICTYS